MVAVRKFLHVLCSNESNEEVRWLIWLLYFILEYFFDEYNPKI